MTEYEAYQEHIRYTHAGLLFAMRPLTLPVCWRRGGNGKSPLNI